jgi:hypothetical protein
MTTFLAREQDRKGKFEGKWASAPRSSAVLESATGAELGTADYGDATTIERAARTAGAARRQWE